MKLVGLYFLCFKRAKVVKHFQELQFVAVFFIVALTGQCMPNRSFQVFNLGRTSLR